MAATHGHTQSLHTNALDEALALPTDFSARIARNTQLFIQQETGITRTIDPWGGSYYVERLTHDLARRAWGHIAGGRGLGRHGPGDRAGHPQAAHRGGRGPHPGAHRRRPADAWSGSTSTGSTETEDIPVLKVDNSAVRASQIEKLERLRAERDQLACRRALDALTRCAETGEGNLLDLAVAGGPRAGHGRRDHRGAGEGLGPPRRRDPLDRRRLRQGGGRARECPPCPRPGRGVRRGGRPPPAHPDRQDGPGRPRPRPEGDRHRLRRPRLRRRHRRPVPDPGRGRAAGGRQRRPHRRRLLAGRRPPDPGARAASASSRPAAAATS